MTGTVILVLQCNAQSHIQVRLMVGSTATYNMCGVPFSGNGIALSDSSVSDVTGGTKQERNGGVTFVPRVFTYDIRLLPDQGL